MNLELRKRIKKILPNRVLTRISADRWWSFREKLFARDGMRNVCLRLMACYGTLVRHGPFMGLQLTREGLLTACNGGMLLGTYEMELHPWFQELRANKFERILDIGSAEGYYAVGIALRTNFPVDAFDAAPTARRLCRSMAKLNGISHLVRLHSWCSRETLLRLNGLRCLVLSDCEGFEVSLFSREVIRALANSDLIIEMHDGSTAAGTTRQLLEARFWPTHKIQYVRFHLRDLSSCREPNLVEMLGTDAIRAITEVREPDQEWLIATPLAKLSPEGHAGS